MKTENNDYIKKSVTANVIDSDEINVLCGKETTKGQEIKVDMEEDKLEFKEQGKVVKLRESEGGLQLAKLEQVGNRLDDELVYFVKEEVDALMSESAMRKIHKILNRKSKEKMNYAYSNARKNTPQVRKQIDRVVRICKICKRNTKSNPKPTVAISRATDFNKKIPFF